MAFFNSLLKVCLNLHDAACISKSQDVLLEKQTSIDLSHIYIAFGYAESTKRGWSQLILCAKFLGAFVLVEERP